MIPLAVWTRRTSRSALVAALSMTLLGIGCSGASNYNKGRKLVKTGNYDAAVAELRQAVAENPSNAVYQTQLADTENLAADKHVEQANEALANRQPRQAKEELQKALELMPAHPQAILMVQNVEGQIARGEELLGQARQAIATLDFEAADRLTNETLQIDASLSEATEIQKQARAGLIDRQVAAANQALDASQFDEVLTHVTAIRQLDATNSRAQELENKVNTRREAVRLYGIARTQLTERQYPQALASLREAATLWQNNDEIQNELQRVASQVVRDIASQANAEVAKNQFAAGVNLYDQALVMTPAQADLLHHRNEAVRQWIEKMLGQYDQYAAAEKWEVAWPMAITALAIDSHRSERAIQAAQLSDQKIRERISYSLSVVPLKSSNARPESVDSACTTLIQEMTRMKPAHVQLLERTNLAEILKEQDLSLANITDRKQLGTLGQKLQGTDLILFVDLASREINDRQTAQKAEAKYIAGKRSEPNPDYAAAQQEVEQAHKKLGKARSGAMLNQMMWDAAGRQGLSSESGFLQRAVGGYYGNQAQAAAEEYNAALMKLNNTPQRLEVDDWRTYQYPIYNVVRQVELKARLRLIEVATGRILWSDNDAAAYAVDRDTQVDGDEAHGVAAKQAILKLSSELELQAAEKIKSILAIKARQVLASRSAVYWEDARNGAGDQTVADYVRFLFDSSSGPNAAAVNKALDEVFARHLNGDRLNACKQIVVERLKLSISGDADQQPMLLATTAPDVPPPPTMEITQASAEQSPTTPLTQPTTSPAASVAPPPEPTLPPPTTTVTAAPTSSPAVAPQPAPVVTPPPPVAASSSVASVPPPVSSPWANTRAHASGSRPPEQQPSASNIASRQQPTDFFQGAVSRDNDTYSKELETIDGIIVKLKDTDAKPLDADLEIHIGRHKGTRDDQPVGARIKMRGLSGRVYELRITAIDNDTETVHFTIDRSPGSR